MTTTSSGTTTHPRRACDGTKEELEADLMAGLEEWEAIKHLYEDD